LVFPSDKLDRMEQQCNASPQVQQVRRLGNAFDTAVAAIILVLVTVESLMLVKLNYSADPSDESRVIQRDRGAPQHDLDWAHSRPPQGLPLQDHGR
jgi:hypothetical protein